MADAGRARPGTAAGLCVAGQPAVDRTGSLRGCPVLRGGRGRGAAPRGEAGRILRQERTHPALHREPGFVVRGSSGAVFGTPQFRPDGRAVARRTGMPAGRAGALFHLATRDRILIAAATRSEEHTSELQSLMRISYAVFCLTKKNNDTSLINNIYTRLT